VCGFSEMHVFTNVHLIILVWSPCQWALTNDPVNVSVYQFLILAGSALKSHNIWTVAGVYLPWTAKWIF
jgi:hypothetical protein